MYQMEKDGSMSLVATKFELEHLLSYYLREVKILEEDLLLRRVNKSEVEFLEYSKKRAAYLKSLIGQTELSDEYDMVIGKSAYRPSDYDLVTDEYKGSNIKYAVFGSDESDIPKFIGIYNNISDINIEGEHAVVMVPSMQPFDKMDDNDRKSIIESNMLKKQKKEPFESIVGDIDNFNIVDESSDYDLPF